MKPFKYTTLTLGLAFILLFASCNSDNNTATVTLNIDSSSIGFKQEMKQFPLIDRFLLLFSEKAYAITAWVSGTTKISLTVSGQGMDNITADIPFSYSSPTTISYTIQVPAGTQRKFSIVSSAVSGGQVAKNWGGKTLVDLSPGDLVNININMVPMTFITLLYNMLGPGVLGVYWQQGTGYPAYVNSGSVRIYRSDAPNGQFSLVQTSPFSTSYVSDTGLQSGKTYYYKVSVVTTYGESAQSDYLSQVAP